MFERGLIINTELVGEIHDFYPNVEVSVVHRDTMALNSSYPNVFRERIGREIEKAGARLILDDEVELSETALETVDYVPRRQITTKKGVKINAELIVSSLLPCASI